MIYFDTVLKDEDVGQYKPNANYYFGQDRNAHIPDITMDLGYSKLSIVGYLGPVELGCDISANIELLLYCVHVIGFSQGVFGSNIKFDCCFDLIIIGETEGMRFLHEYFHLVELLTNNIVVGVAQLYFDIGSVELYFVADDESVLCVGVEGEALICALGKYILVGDSLH